MIVRPLVATLLLLPALQAADSDAVKRGRILFVRSCAGCHGNDGKALMDAGGDATDLTDPKAYRHGSSDNEILSSIRDGANGMPAFRSSLKEEDLQRLLHFIHTLWKK